MLYYTILYILLYTNYVYHIVLYIYYYIPIIYIILDYIYIKLYSIYIIIKILYIYIHIKAVLKLWARMHSSIGVVTPSMLETTTVIISYKAYGNFQHRGSNPLDAEKNNAVYWA